jgi:hypothetical protein
MLENWGLGDGDGAAGDPWLIARSLVVSQEDRTEVFYI